LNESCAFAASRRKIAHHPDLEPAFFALLPQEDLLRDLIETGWRRGRVLIPFFSFRL